MTTIRALMKPTTVKKMAEYFNQCLRNERRNMATSPTIHVRIDAKPLWISKPVDEVWMKMYEYRVQALAHKLEKEVATLIANQIVEGNNPLFADDPA